MGVKRVDKEEIEKINQLYYELGSYSAVAKEIGRSAGTVKKYVIDGWKPKTDNIKDDYSFNIVDLSNYNHLKWNKGDNLGIYCVLTDEEKRKVANL